MTTTGTIIVLALLITGVATATVYAVPVLQQAYAAGTQSGDRMQSQDHLRLQDGTLSGEMAQTQLRRQLSECTQTCDCTCEGPCDCNQSDSAPATGSAYQNHVSLQTCLRTQHRSQLGGLK